MYKILVPIAVLLFASCSPGDKKENATTIADNNHINFLSIGNGYYLGDVNDKVNYFINVPAANSSAGYFSDHLSCYGKGLALSSSKDSLLSKAIMLQYIDSMIRLSIKDSMSTNFIYYCGHGFSDKLGNIYLVPGNHRFNENDASSLESLLSINEIQQRVLDALHKEYPNTKLNEKDGMRVQAAFMGFAKKITGTARFQEGNSFMKEISEFVRERASNLVRPRFVFIADCCTDKYNTVNFSLLLNKKFSNGFNKGEKKLMEMKAKLGRFSKYSIDKVIATNRNLIYNSSVGLLKTEIWMGGNRTMYTAEVGKPAAMVPSPLDAEEKVGPICRRLMLFFKTKKSFSIAQMLGSICDEKFDNLSPAPKFEEGNVADWFTSDPMALVQKHKTKIGDHSFLDKRDSVNYVCSKSE